MTFGKTAALVIGFLGAMMLGIWISPYVTDREWSLTDDPVARVTESAKETPTNPSSVSVKSRRPASSMPKATQSSSAGQTSTLTASAPIAVSAPELHARLKPLLNQGANVAIASEGFRDAEQFAALAHAARNTEVPFMLLKHRVLNEGKPLAAAIRESKPDLNATIEANRARAEAKSDLAALGG